MAFKVYMLLFCLNFTALLTWFSLTVSYYSHFFVVVDCQDKSMMHGSEDVVVDCQDKSMMHGSEAGYEIGKVATTR